MDAQPAARWDPNKLAEPWRDECPPVWRGEQDGFLAVATTLSRQGIPDAVVAATIQLLIQRHRKAIIERQSIDLPRGAVFVDRASLERFVREEQRRQAESQIMRLEEALADRRWDECDGELIGVFPAVLKREKWMRQRKRLTQRKTEQSAAAPTLRLRIDPAAVEAAYRRQLAEEGYSSESSAESSPSESLSTYGDTAIEEAAQLLVQHGVDAHQPGSLTVVAAARRAGLSPADAAALGIEVKSATKGAQLRRGDEDGFAAHAARDPDPQQPTLRELLPPTGRHARAVWLRLASILALEKCRRCGQPRDDGRRVQCDTCRRKNRRRVKRHRTKHKAARPVRYRTPGVVGDEAARPSGGVNVCDRSG